MKIYCEKVFRCIARSTTQMFLTVDFFITIDIILLLKLDILLTDIDILYTKIYSYFNLYNMNEDFLV